MTTLIDQFLLKFGVDGSGVATGAAEINKSLADISKQAEALQKSLNFHAKTTVNALQSIKRQAVGLAAVLTGGSGFKRMIVDITEANAQLGLFSKNYEISTQKVQAGRLAVQLAGGSAGDFDATIRSLSMSATEFAVTGQSALIPFLRALNIDFLDTSKGSIRMRDSFALMYDFHTKFKDIETKAGRANAFNFGVMGGINPGTMNMLLASTEDFKAMIKAQKELDLITQRDAESSMKLRQAFIHLRFEADLAWNHFVLKLTPGLIKFFEWLERVGTWLSHHRELMKEFFIGAATAITAYFLPAILRATASMLAFDVAAALPIAACIALGAAIMLLKNDYDTWKSGGDSLIDWSKWGPGIDSAVEGIRNLYNEIKHLIDLVNDNLAGTWLGNLIGAGTAHVLAAMGNSSAQAAIDRNTPRSQRNNNPLNLEFAGQAGATREPNLGSGSRFAKFGSLAEGTTAGYAQMSKRVGEGFNTPAALVKKWLGGDWNPTVGAAYTDAITAGTGLGATSTIDINNPQLMEKLFFAMAGHEGPLGMLDKLSMHGAIQSAQNPATRLPAAAGAASAATGATARSAATRAGSGSTNVRSEVNIGNITVQTQATDSKGIARDIGSDLRERGFVYQSDSGIVP